MAHVHRLFLLWYCLFYKLGVFVGDNNCDMVVFHSMYDTYSDEFGMIDFQRSQHGSGMSQRSQVQSTTA